MKSSQKDDVCLTEQEAPLLNGVGRYLITSVELSPMDYGWIPARSGAVPAELVDKLMARAQGNPFFLEEMLNFLRDRGLDPRDPHDLKQIELPDSLHALILSRIDKLSEGEKTVLRVASIVGRLFRVEWLLGCYPEFGDGSQVMIALEHLVEMHIISLDSPAQSPQGEPPAYLFNHIITHEVTYENLPHSLRVRLHGQLAAYLEKQIAAGTMTEVFLLDVLVYHYTRSENKPKQRKYLKKAGQAALDVSAFNTAAESFTRLLELLPVDDPEHSSLSLRLAEIQGELGNYTAARAAIQQAQNMATSDAKRAAALTELGGVTKMTIGDYAQAQTILAQAIPLARNSGDQSVLCRALYTLGDLNWRQGKLDDAHVALEESLALARALGNVRRELFALNRLGTGLKAQNRLDDAEQIFIEVHAKAVAIGNRERMAAALINLGTVAHERQDYVSARNNYQQALTLAREIGAQDMIALVLINLATADIQLGDLPSARAELHAGLMLALQLGITPRVKQAVMYSGNLAYAERKTERALALWGLARRQPSWTSEDQRDQDLTLAQWNLDPTVVEAGLAKGAELDWDATIQELLKE